MLTNSGQCPTLTLYKALAGVGGRASTTCLMPRLRSDGPPALRFSDS